MFDPKIDRSVPRNLYVNRGVSSWTDGKRRLVFLGDIEGRLWAIDALTGRPDPAFGAKGVVNLREGVATDAAADAYGVTAAPGIFEDLIILGMSLADGAHTKTAGDLRAFHVRTGKEAWRSRTVPPPGEPGNETWAEGSWKDRGAANAWSGVTIDAKGGRVFASTGSAAYDFYGGDRLGDNLFANSVLCLDARTGKRLWHFQTVHHDLWDYDLPAPPTLVTVTREGRDVDAAAQVTKMGFVFSSTAATASPCSRSWRRPFPKSPIPGEEAHPTQPVPLRPPPFARQSMTRGEITDVTPDSRKECEAIAEGALLDTGLYQPFGERDQALFPGLNGGANYGGASYDPGSRLLFVNSMDVGGLFRLVKRREEAAVPYALRARKYEFFTDSKGYPCQKPPWGSLTAIDLDRGEIRWRTTLGEIPELGTSASRRREPPTSAARSSPTAASSSSRPRATAASVPSTATRATSCGRRSCRRAARGPRHLPRAKDGQAVRHDGGGREQVRQGIQRTARRLRSARFHTVTPRVLLGAGVLAVVSLSVAAAGSGAEQAASGYVPREEPLPGPEVRQPVLFSHRVHAVAARLECLDCHGGATRATPPRSRRRRPASSATPPSERRARRSRSWRKPPPGASASPGRASGCPTSSSSATGSTSPPRASLARSATGRSRRGTRCARRSRPA